MSNHQGSFLGSAKNLLMEVFLFLSIVFLVHLCFAVQKNKLAYEDICKAISSNYLESLSNKNLKKCLSVNSIFNFSNKSKIHNFNQWFKHFHISHLYIYNAAENEKMWKGRSRETGILVKKIFGKWRVVKLLAKNSQIEIGDQILSINGEKVKSSNHIAYTAGEFVVLRGKKKLKIQVVYSNVFYDNRMLAKPINAEWAYLKIPSFRSEFFGYDELSRLYPKLKDKNLVLDVRDNSGGNFISVVRLLSMMKCSEQVVGKIYHNRTDQVGDKFLADDLSDISQIEQVTQTNPLNLKLFKTELCLNTPKVSVVMNEGTASVSELFVQILKDQYKNLHAFGTNTAGQMVLSIWYPVKFLGPEVLISIPYAWATANDNEILEGLGVYPTESIDSTEIEKYVDSLDPLLDYVLENEKIVPEQKSSLGGVNG